MIRNINCMVCGKRADYLMPWTYVCKECYCTKQTEKDLEKYWEDVGKLTKEVKEAEILRMMAVRKP